MLAATITAVTDLLGQIAGLIINPLIVLGFVVATVFLFYGIAQMIWKSDSGDLGQNRKNVMYGIIGLFIMFSVYGILRLVMESFGIPCSGIFFC
jgi:hypothetical protein